MAKKNQDQQEIATTVASAPAVDEMTEELVAPAPAVTDLSEYSYGEEHAANAIHLKASEVLIPMLRIVQESSKIWKSRPKDSTIKLGDIYDSVNGTVYDGEKGVLLVPIDTSACVIERKAAPDGSFIAKLKVRDPRVQTAYAANGSDGWKQLKSATKTQFNYTEEVLVALIDPSDGLTARSAAMIPFAGTNVYPGLKWRNKMAGVPRGTETPSYAFRTILRTKKRPNAAIESYIFQADPYGYVPGGQDDAYWSSCRLTPRMAPDTLARCLDFKNLYATGTLGKTDYSEADASETDLENAAFSGDKPAF